MSLPPLAHAAMVDVNNEDVVVEQIDGNYIDLKSAAKEE